MHPIGGCADPACPVCPAQGRVWAFAGGGGWWALDTDGADTVATGYPGEIAWTVGIAPNQEIRLRCLEAAVALSAADDINVINAAEKFEKFVLGET